MPSPLLTELVETGEAESRAPACCDDPGVDPGLLGVAQHHGHPQAGEQAATGPQSHSVLHHKVVTHKGLGQY